MTTKEKLEWQQKMLFKLCILNLNTSWWLLEMKRITSRIMEIEESMDLYKYQEEYDNLQKSLNYLLLKGNFDNKERLDFKKLLKDN